MDDSIVPCLIVSQYGNSDSRRVVVTLKAEAKTFAMTPLLPEKLGRSAVINCRDGM